MAWFAECYFYLKEFNTLSCLVRLLVSAALGGVVGIEREKQGRAVGLRTHMLVCIGATVTVVVGLYTAHYLGFANDPMRLGAQVISGIGFLGAGTILMRDNNQIVGLTTAAGLWTTAAIGLVVGTGFYVFAVATTTVVVSSMVLLGKVESRKQKKRNSHSYYVELENIEYVQPLIDLPWQKTVQLIAPKTAIVNHVGVYIVMSGISSDEEIVCQERLLREQPGVLCIIDSRILV